MYRLMISFSSKDFKNPIWKNPCEYLLSDSEEVCKVITSLSHLNPVITLCQIPVLSASEVLKDFELKEVRI